ncbi:MAG TPA: hypothetical protein DEO87_00680 [Lachnospiraceae bacterium]|nr:hypothetical protein [Lachnospiraceae bacterium]
MADKKLVALCTSRVYDPQIHGYIERLNERLKVEGYSLLIFAINSDIYWDEDRVATEKYIFDLIPYKDMSGIIIMDEKIKSHKIAEKIIGFANIYNVPVAVSDGHYDNVSCVNFDYEMGFEQVVRHIIEHHKPKRPHMMAGQPDNDFSNHRIEIFKRVLAENGIEFDKSMLSYGYFWADPCRVATTALLKRDVLPDAIICANDNMAITVSEMFTEAGYKVPGDVIISGFDGYDEIYFTSPKITTASCDILLMAEATADVFLATVADGHVHNKMIMPTFIPNESCGCPEHTEHPYILRDWFRESFSRHNDDNRVLQQITSSMQISQDPGELVSYLESYKTEGLLAAVDRECFFSDDNYFTGVEEFSKTKQFVLIYDSDYPERYKPESFVIPDITPDSTEDVLSEPFRSRILELTESGYPLIFNSLVFMNRSFGFACYYYRNYLITNYSNTMNVTNAISIGFGGYINTQYQRMLLDKVDRMYRHDSLTGLYNRIGFQNRFRKIINNPAYKGQKVTLFMSDLDGLKSINDRFGHGEGDNAIAEVARALDASTPENSISVRFGGDELFSVIFGECNPEDIITRIDAYLSSYNECSGKPYKVSASCGHMTSILDDDFNITQVLKQADEQMYIIKRNKKSS